MGWFKSAEEKAAEKRKEELIEKEKKKAVKQKVLDYFDKEHGFILLSDVWFEDNPHPRDYDLVKSVAEKQEYPMNAMKFIQVVKELIEEGQLFTYDTWKGEALPDFLIDDMLISVFTKSYAEGLITSYKEKQKEKQKKDQKWKNLIIDLLTKKSIKMTISDITAHIKHDDRDKVKSLLEEMHKDGKIDFGGSGRYFIYSEEKKEPKKEVPKTEEVDVEKELGKLKGLLDKGLITQEQYDAKSNELLGL